MLRRREYQVKKLRNTVMIKLIFLLLCGCGVVVRSASLPVDREPSMELGEEVMNEDEMEVIMKSLGVQGVAKLLDMMLEDVTMDGEEEPIDVGNKRQTHTPYFLKRALSTPYFLKRGITTPYFLKRGISTPYFMKRSVNTPYFLKRSVSQGVVSDMVENLMKYPGMLAYFHDPELQDLFKEFNHEKNKKDVAAPYFLKRMFEEEDK